MTNKSHFKKHFHTKFVLVAILSKLQFAGDIALFAIHFSSKFDEIDAC
jgi:hypothetical protein